MTGLVDVRYEALWSASASPDDFARRLAEAWREQYLRQTCAHQEDLVTVDPGNGFLYDFDLAGTMRDDATQQHPRVIGVWGRSRAPAAARDHARMRGHPRRGTDDRGHLVAHTAGGEYDINLVPMAPSLNRGWSDEGRRFRASERLAAEHPGSIYFVHLLYGDHTDRPARLVVGVARGDELYVDCFVNPPSEACTGFGPLRQALPLAIDRGVIASCIGHDRRDPLFERAWSEGIGGLSRRERNAIAGVTGHIAESVAAMLLLERGWDLLWQFATTGRHGVDLVLLAPDEHVVAVEVKGTLVPGRTPNLSRRQLGQMTSGWIDKPDNPGIGELRVKSREIVGAVVAVNLADLTWRSAFTTDFQVLRPVTQEPQLASLDWLDGPAKDS